MHRTIATGCAVLGIFTMLFCFIIILRLISWNPSRLELGLAIITIAMINIGGLVYLIRKRRDHPLWLVIIGISGNVVSLFVIVYSILGLLYLEYVFRM